MPDPEGVDEPVGETVGVIDGQDLSQGRRRRIPAFRPRIDRMARRTLFLGYAPAVCNLRRIRCERRASPTCLFTFRLYWPR